MANGVGWRIERSTISVVTAVGIACALIPIGWIARDRLADFERSQAELKHSLDDLSRRIGRIEQSLAGKSPEAFHRADMNEWCASVRTIASNASFTCPDPYALPSYLRRWGRLEHRR